MTLNDSESRAGSDGGSEGAVGRFAYEGLERVFHEKARLSIMTSLVAHPRGLVFSDLKELCSLTDGNLSRHLQVLHEAGLIEITKGFQRKRPQTRCLLTDDGRRRFLDYINVLESVVADTLSAARQRSRVEPKAKANPKPESGIAEGWSPA
jgi:DNA-binding MarR family transcriptional regulator